jgi:hypothetical protein
MKNSGSLWFRLGLGGAVLIVGLAFILLVVNLASHAINPASKSPVTTSVDAVRAVSPSEAEVTATVVSRSSVSAQVSCLVGIEMPSTPLAYPIRVTENLKPYESKTLVVQRMLLKPYAEQVTRSDVAFVCT